MTETPEKLRSLKYYTLFGFFVIGVITVLLGQVLPILKLRLDLNDAEAGLLLTAQFSGALTGTVLIGVLVKRLKFIVVLLVGLVLMMVGLPALNSGHFVVCWLGIFVYGLGIGLSIPATNLLTIDVTEIARQSSAVNLLNFAWGIGAICSQPFAAALSTENSLLSVTVILFAALLVMAACFLSVLRKLRAGGSEADNFVRDADVAIWSRPEAWLFIFFAFFAVGVEGGVSGWLTTYSESLRAKGLAPVNATVVYFFFFILGRGIASIISRRISDNALISACSVLMVSGLLVIVTSESLALIGAAITGLGSSALFPTNMVRFAKVFGPGSTRRATPIFVAGTSGAAVITSLIGVVSHSFGSLRLGIAVILVSAAFVAVLQIAIVMTFRRG